MRSTTVGLALIVVIATGCASGSAQRTPSQAGATGEPARAGSSSDPQSRETRARELLELGRTAMASGDLNGAIEAYRQVLARVPDHADARYNLALVLKLTHRDAEAAPEFLAAAGAGHPRAQFFTGTAYARGLGVEPDTMRAILWWSRAADQGNLEAIAALGELRQTALGKSRRAPGERRAVEQAVRDYRSAL